MTPATVTANSSGGMGVLSLLGVLFVALKLLGYISWSWWWVTLPFWGGAAFIVGMLLLAIVLMAIAAIVSR